MPVGNISRFTCSITYQTFDMSQNAPPPNWYPIGGDHFHPLAVILIGKRIVAAHAANTPIDPTTIMTPATAAELQSVGLPVPPGVT